MSLNDKINSDIDNFLENLDLIHKFSIYAFTIFVFFFNECESWKRDFVSKYFLKIIILSKSPSFFQRIFSHFISAGFEAGNLDEETCVWLGAIGGLGMQTYVEIRDGYKHMTIIPYMYINWEQHHLTR